MNSRRVLVTGLRGFTGQHAANALQATGHEVFGLEWNGAPVSLLDRDAVREVVRTVRPTHVMHLAAVAFVALGDADVVYRTNIVGSRHLLEALADEAPDIKQVLLASSANVYGNAEVESLDEQVSAAPANDYAVSKLAMEHMASLWADRLPLTIVRPFNYTGCGQSEQFVIPKIVAHARQGSGILELGNLDVWREYNDVRWVAEAYCRLLDADSVGRTINIASGRTWSLREVIALVEQLSGRQIPVTVNSAFVRHNEVVRLRGDGSCLQQLVGKLPHYSLEDTLRWMLS